MNSNAQTAGNNYSWKLPASANKASQLVGLQRQAYKTKVAITGHTASSVYGKEMMGTEEVPVVLSDLGWESVQADLEAEFARSKRLLALEPNWDGEDSPGYTQEVLDRAQRLVGLTVKQLLSHPKVDKAVPSIDAGPNGSIDIYWQNGDRELLLNLPAIEGELAEFYGTDDTGVQVKGKLDPNTAQGWLIAWVAK
jgi:hypothetical protein